MNNLASAAQGILDLQNAHSDAKRYCSRMRSLIQDSSSAEKFFVSVWVFAELAASLQISAQATTDHYNLLTKSALVPTKGPSLLELEPSSEAILTRYEEWLEELDELMNQMYQNLVAQYDEQEVQGISDQQVRDLFESLEQGFSDDDLDDALREWSNES